MIEQHIADAIKRFGPGKGTAVCLGDQQLPSGDPPSAFFRGLGYSSYYDVDYNGHAQVNADLNYPLPPGLAQADLLYDGGVIEHVSNISQAWTSIVQLVKVGGVLVQANPINTYGESYYCIDPMMHRDFYRANGFSELRRVIYYHPSLRWWFMEQLDYRLPTAWNALFRNLLRPSQAMRQFAYPDLRVKTLPPNRKYPHLPRRSATLYIGRKERDIPRIIWPHQSLYQSKNPRA